MASTFESFSPGDFRQRLFEINESDAEKSAMIKVLIEKLEESQGECNKLSLDLQSEGVIRRGLQVDIKEFDKLKARRGFVLVLIDADGDDYIFHKRFLDQNEIGGRRAADELHARISDYLGKLQLNTQNLDIVVRAYANFKGLKAACVRKGRMSQDANIDMFTQGFTRRQPLFDFVDVGKMKEEADNKVKECLKFYEGIFQCKHIVLGVCHDSGYAPYLNQFASDVSKRTRITLLEGGGVNRISGLGFNSTLKLETVFSPYEVAAPSAPIPTPGPTLINRTMPMHVNPSPLTHKLGAVLYNQAGQRVDKMLKIDISSPYLNVLRQNKLCHWYYLRGKCDGGCNKNHVPSPLSDRDFDCLWYVSRGGLCHKVRKGKVCEDSLCVYGHEEGCQLGTGRT